MKLLVFFLVILSFPLHAQWNVDADSYTSGKVGIGISAPTELREKLDVVGTSAGASSAVTKIRIYQPANLVGADANLVSGVTNGTNPYFAIETRDGNSPWNVLERLRIDHRGYLGIGTNSPLSQVHISGNNAALRVSSTSGVEFLDIWQDGTTGTHIKSTATSGSAYNLFMYGKSHVFKTWRNNQWQEAARITDEGYVGIGTSSPDDLLTVKGTIHSREVQVDMDGPLQGPDYVFENDYALLSLAELEAYIRKNKHLPEVPSAREMAENGLLLKEMNLLLLKKVEELTLHLIEQNKKMDQQLELNQKQTLRIDQLATELNELRKRSK